MTIESLIGFPWQDLALSAGGVVGLANKIQAVFNTNTQWNSQSAAINAVMFVPSIAAFYSYGLYLTMVMATASMFCWTFISLFRGEGGGYSDSADTRLPLR